MPPHHHYSLIPSILVVNYTNQHAYYDIKEVTIP